MEPLENSLSCNAIGYRDSLDLPRWSWAEWKPFDHRSPDGNLGRKKDSLTHTLPHSLTHTLTHSLTPSFPHSHPHSLTSSLTHSHPHSLTSSLTHTIPPSLTHILPLSLYMYVPSSSSPLLGKHSGQHCLVSPPLLQSHSRCRQTNSPFCEERCHMMSLQQYMIM